MTVCKSRIFMELDLNSWKVKGLAIATFILAFLSCEPTPVSLNREERVLLDSLYDDYRDSILRPVLDDSCIKITELYFEKWVDSLIEVRKKELYEILERR